MCFHVTQKYFLHQLDSKSPDSLVDKQTHQPTLELFLKIVPIVSFRGLSW